MCSGDTLSYAISSLIDSVCSGDWCGGDLTHRYKGTEVDTYYLLGYFEVVHVIDRYQHIASVLLPRFLGFRLYVPTRYYVLY